MTNHADKASVLSPDYIMETSWEVCNKVGGIYAVLSTRSATMIEEYGCENVIFVGPWLAETEQKDFIRSESHTTLENSLSHQSGLPVFVGHWDVPGHPLCFLVDYKPLYEKTSSLYSEMWESFHIHTWEGYGDYDESCHFAMAAAMVMKAYDSERKADNPLSIFNEWQMGMGLLWLNLHASQIATIFITHATTVGRSIAGNGKELYKYMQGYNGDQMARELNVWAKHEVEKRSAWVADAFCTVSEVTNVECKQLLEKGVDQIVYNGFEQDFVPEPTRYDELRETARKRLINIASVTYGVHLNDNILMVVTSGRSEYRNKGLDVFIDSIGKLSDRNPDRQIMPIIAVPSWVKCPRTAINFGIETGESFDLPMHNPFKTHELYDTYQNPIVVQLRSLSKKWGTKVFPLFIPSYLNSSDGILNIKYFDFLPAVDLAIFPSYYEPWGYTPLETMAFGIPSITTDKAGYGMWARDLNESNSITEGIEVLHRTDGDPAPMVEKIADTIEQYSKLDSKQVIHASTAAKNIAAMAEWHHFFPQYTSAFDIALQKKNKRNS